MALSVVHMYSLLPTSDDQDRIFCEELHRALEAEFPGKTEWTEPQSHKVGLTAIDAVESQLHFEDDFLPVTFRVIAVDDEKLRLIHWMAHTNSEADRFKSVVKSIGRFDDVWNAAGGQARAYKKFGERIFNQK